MLRFWALAVLAFALLVLSACADQRVADLEKEVQGLSRERDSLATQVAKQPTPPPLPTTTPQPTPTTVPTLVATPAAPAIPTSTPPPATPSQPIFSTGEAKALAEAYLEDVMVHLGVRVEGGIAYFEGIPWPLESPRDYVILLSDVNFGLGDELLSVFEDMGVDALEAWPLCVPTLHWLFYDAHLALLTNPTWEDVLSEMFASSYVLEDLKTAVDAELDILDSDSRGELESGIVPIFRRLDPERCQEMENQFRAALAP